MNAAVYSILSVVAVSLISFVGVLTLITRLKAESRFLAFLVSFAAGALLGDVFIHLLPELSAKQKFNQTTSAYVLGAIILLFIIEKYIHWHHHGNEDDHAMHAKPFVFTNLFGDGLHNMIDGMVITGAYLLDIRLGLATTVAVILHEIPQEFADFGVLIYGGLTTRKALFYNFLSALAALIGAVVVLIFGSNQNIESILVALGAGTFIYIAVADLIPEIHREEKNTGTQLISFGLGIFVMYLLLFLE
ncbi:MAG: ZIP family metal transporter [Candidatus Doudnabacteria bacterium]|nr:ZIP family metal transporter [Candidatus Doudnabacteria bacterium]